MTTSTLDSSSLPAVAFIDLQREIATTRRVLERLPEEHFTWRVHEKSMNLGRLATHVATLLQWFHDTLTKDELDMNVPPVMPIEAKTRAELLQIFDDNAAAVQSAMAADRPGGSLENLDVAARRESPSPAAASRHSPRVVPQSLDTPPGTALRLFAYPECPRAGSVF